MSRLPPLAIPAPTADALLKHLIQTHRDIGMVELFRAERQRRTTSKLSATIIG